MANKYYALAQNKPELKVDLFGNSTENADLSRIKRVNIFRTKDERILCAPVIDGIEKVQPRVVTPQQWQRMWAAEDMAEYKTNLAAKLFADVLQQANTQAQTQESKQEEQPRMTSDSNAQMQSFTPAMQKQYDRLKDKHLDTVLLFRTGDSYVAYKGDAQTASRILGLDVEQGDKADTVSFPFRDLDTHLPKLIRAGQRVAICDRLEDSKQAVSQENEARVGRGR